MLNVPQDPNLLSPANAPTREEGIDLVAILVSVLMEWRLGLTVFLIAAVLGAGIIFSLKPQYVAQATILPQEGHTQADALASIFTTRGPGGLYIGLLKSRSVQDSVINNAGLLKLFHTKSYETAREMLAGKSSFVDGAENIVTISVRDESAQNASMIANAYLAALRDLDDHMGASQSDLTRRFFESQLKNEREALTEAELKLEATQKQTGLIQPESQTSLGLNSIANIRAQITQLQVQLAALLQGATEENPQVKALRSQIDRLQAEEAALEGGGRTPLGAAPTADSMPSASLDYLRAQREVTYHTALVTSLANQYEAARLTEDFGRSMFLVIDRAIAPEHKAWPPRKPFLIFVLILAALIGLGAIVIRLALLRILRDPSQQENLQALRHMFRKA